MGYGGQDTGVSVHFNAKPEEHKNRVMVDPAGIGGRKMLLPGEISECSGNISGEVSRGHSSWTKRAVKDIRRTHSHNEGLNIKMFQMQHGGVPAML